MAGVFWMGVCLAWGQEGTSADDLRKGRDLATMLYYAQLVISQRQTRVMRQPYALQDHSPVKATSLRRPTGRP